MWRPQRGGGLGGASPGGRPGWLLDDEPEAESGTLHGEVLPGPSHRSDHGGDRYQATDHYSSADRHQAGDHASSSYPGSGYPQPGYAAGYGDQSAASPGGAEPAGYGSTSSSGYSGGDYAANGYQPAQHQPAQPQSGYHSSGYESGGYRSTDDYQPADYGAPAQEQPGYGAATGYGVGASDYQSRYPSQPPSSGYGSDYPAAGHQGSGPVGYGGEHVAGYSSPLDGGSRPDERYWSGGEPGQAQGQPTQAAWYPEQAHPAGDAHGAGWQQAGEWSPDGGLPGAGLGGDPQVTAAFPSRSPSDATAAMSAIGQDGAGDPFDYLYRSDREAAETMAVPSPPGPARTPTATRMLAPPAEAPPRSRRAPADGTSTGQPAPESGGRAARRRAATKPRGTTGSRVALAMGELLMTTGALALLFVIYQLWWTNVLADRAMTNKGSTLEQQWKKNPTLSPLPNDAFAFMYIPRLGSDYRKVVMQGVDKNKVLDKGAIGHYTETAMPGAAGNFSVAAHRNTHGEPFRYLNTLQVGDKVVVETGTTWYTYQLDKELPQTSPSNVGVISKVPKGGPFTKTGDYLTLTTCTPDFTSWYRLIWWGHLVSTQPRNANGPMPAALAGYTGAR